MANRFSIRDYAAKKRNVDLAKSWPFVRQKEERPYLPPISIRSFRWWADELSAARSAAESVETKAEETLNEIIEYQSPKSPPISEVEEFRLIKKKTRLPKKRSIMELFASVPQIEIEIRASKKEKDCKPKMTSSRHSQLHQDPTNKKAHRKTAECVAESKKLAKVKILQKKHNILQSPNPISENQKAVKKLPARSILKNKKSFPSARKNTKINNTKRVKFIKRYGKITKQVSFSEEENILGHNKNCSSIDLPQFKSPCKIFSDVLTKSSVMKKSSKAQRLRAENDGPQVVKQSEEDTNVGAVDRTDESSFKKIHLSDSIGNVDHEKFVNSSNSSYSVAVNASMAAVIDLNHAIETSNDFDYFNPSAENSSPSEGNFYSVSNAANLLATMKNPSQHNPTCCLIACNEKQNEKQCQHYFDVDMNCTHHIPEKQSEHYYSPKDLLSSNICHSMGSNKLCESVFLSNLVSTSRSKSSGEDFNGLPVNKQGELIQLLPGTKFFGPYMKQNIDLASSHGFYANMQAEQDINANPLKIMKEKDLDAALYQNDQLNWCPNQHHPISERRFTEFIGPERFKIQKNETVRGNYAFFHPHANKTKLSFHDGEIGDPSIDFFKKEDLLGKCNSAPVTQPMIRLMGQDVVVGGTDRNCHCSMMPEKYLSKEAFGSSTGSLLKLTDNSPSILYHTRVPQFDTHFDDRVSESLLRNNIFSTSGNNISKIDHDTHAVPHKTILNKTDKLTVNSILEEESMRHQYYPTIASCQHNIQQNKLLGSAQCNHGQGVSYGTFLTPQSMYRYKVHENSFQSVQIQPSENLPQWLHQTKHLERNQLSSSPYSCQIDLSQPFRNTGTDLIPHLSQYNMPMVPFSIDNISPATSTFAPNSSQSSYISVVTATNSISEVTKSTSIKNKEGSYCNFKGFSSPVNAHKFLKRPAEMDDVFMNSAKIPQFEKHANYGIHKAVNEVVESSNAESSSFSAVGGTKMVAGEKYVLKTNQKLDEGKILSPEKQIAKVYKF